MATHSSTLAWKIPWTEEPGGLQSMGSLRVGYDWATSVYFSLSCVGEGNGNPLQCSCLENPREGGAWWAAVYGVAQSRKRLKQLSSSSSSSASIGARYRRDDTQFPSNMEIIHTFQKWVWRSFSKFVKGIVGDISLLQKLPFKGKNRQILPVLLASLSIISLLHLSEIEFEFNCFSV